MPSVNVPSAKKSRSRRSKAEVQEEFDSLVESSASAKEETSSKNKVVLELKEAEIRDSVSEITVEFLTKKIMELKSEVNLCLSNISDKMISEVNILTNLREAASLESKELAKLHEIDIAATSIDQLIIDYETKKIAFENELKQQQEQWENEQEFKEKEEKEYQDSLKKNRQRENEDYEYKKALERKKVQDKYEEECYLRQKQNKENQETLEKNWQSKEIALKQKEEEFLKLQKEVEQFPARLASENVKAVENALKQSEIKSSQEIINLKKDLQVEKQLSELKIKALQETISIQQQQISALQAQLEEAKKQVQDIAIRAIEGASGAKALSHINQIAMEQAKTRGGQS